MLARHYDMQHGTMKCVAPKIPRQNLADYWESNNYRGSGWRTLLLVAKTDVAPPAFGGQKRIWQTTLPGKSE